MASPKPMSTCIRILACLSRAQNSARTPAYAASSRIGSMVNSLTSKASPSSGHGVSATSVISCLIASSSEAPEPSRSTSRVARCGLGSHTDISTAPFRMQRSRAAELPSRYSQRSAAKRTSVRSNSSPVSLATVRSRARTEAATSGVTGRADRGAPAATSTGAPPRRAPVRRWSRRGGGGRPSVLRPPLPAPPTVRGGSNPRSCGPRS